MNKQEKILVPLDGSELAEKALVEVLRYAKALKPDVTLLQVVSIPDDVIHYGGETFSIDEQWEALKTAALRYLNSVRNRPEWGDVATHVAVETNDPAEAILNYCQKHDVDKIVMTTHGRTGKLRWVFGSVAFKVLQAADRTVVLIRP
jgi:nucleotide-binding universal stress UspA family protein